jgi:septal ring factor EnvC (AmiA/AmiB activator)
MKFSISSGIPTPNDPEKPITAEEGVRQVRGVRIGIPNFVQLQTAQLKAMNRVAGIDPLFLEAAFAAMNESEALRSVLGADDQQLRTQRQDVAQWQSLVEEVDALRQGVTSTVKLQQHQIATIALQVYAVARGLVRNGQHPDLIPHVETMRRLLRHAKRQKDAADAKAPTPPKA